MEWHIQWEEMFWTLVLILAFAAPVIWYELKHKDK